MARASTTVGTPGVPGYVVQFDCNNFFFDCEGGAFQFVLVDCGCPGGETPLLVCRANEIANARNAVSRFRLMSFPYFSLIGHCHGFSIDLPCHSGANAGTNGNAIFLSIFSTDDRV